MSTRAAPKQNVKNNGKAKGKAKATLTSATSTVGETEPPNIPDSSHEHENEHEKDINDDDEDSENDSDFVPLAPGADESESESDDEGRRNAKKAKLTQNGEQQGPGEAGLDEQEEKRRKEETRRRLWEEFQASLTTPPVRKAPEPPKTVKVVKKYRFAGEDVTKVEEVPENSPDAKKWPQFDPIKHAALDKPTSLSSLFSPSRLAGTPQPGSSASTPTADTTSTGTSTTIPTTPLPPSHPRPGPRRSRKSLDAMFADAAARAAAKAQAAQAKAKKLSTLDKSAMDWKEHVENDVSEDMREDLEANRRGGGYLEKVAFLERVEERKELVREEAMGRKRRRA